MASYGYYEGNWMIDGDDGSHPMSPKYVHTPVEITYRCPICEEDHKVLDTEQYDFICPVCLGNENYWNELEE